jgi:hypothetical protein
MTSHANKKIGICYLLPVIGILIMWYVVLLKANPPGITPKGSLIFLLTQGPRLWFFRWLLVLPTLCVLLATAYFSSIPKTRLGYSALITVGIALALAAWLTVSVDIAVCTTLPLVYSLFGVKTKLLEEKPGS